MLTAPAIVFLRFSDSFIPVANKPLHLKMKLVLVLLSNKSWYTYLRKVYANVTIIMGHNVCFLCDIKKNLWI